MEPDCIIRLGAAAVADAMVPFGAYPEIGGMYVLVCDRERPGFYEFRLIRLEEALRRIGR